MPVIEIKDLVKEYGEITAVNHLNLEIEKGEIFGLLGPNGAGKTTIILSILGLSEPTGGTVTVMGHNATSEPLKVRKVTGYLPDEVGFSDNSTGLESLVYTAMLNGIPEDEARNSAKELLEIVGLKDAGTRKTKTYSKGMTQRLGLADVLIKKPEIMVLDEPTIGIDPKGIIDFLALIRKLSKEQGITVLLSSHLLHQVQKICDRVGILVSGKLLAVGNINELSDNLFGGNDTVITAQVDPITDGLMTALKNETTIKDVRMKDNVITIKAGRDMAPAISKTIIHNGGNLYRLSCQEYGLDEIYQRYFEGGDENA